MAKKKRKKRKRQIQLPEWLVGFLAAIIVICGCFVRVRLTNRYGDMGSAYFGIALQWLLLLLAPVGIGMSGAVSDMVLSRLERGSIRSARKVVRTAVLGSVLCSILLCLLGTLCADFLTGSLMGVSMAGMALKGCLPALLPLGVILALAGGMDGFGSTSLIRTIRGFFCLLLFIVAPLLVTPFYEYGEKVGAFLQNEQYAPAFGALGSAIGLLAVSVVVMVVSAAAWWRNNPAIAGLQRAEDVSTERQGQLLKSIFVKSLPTFLPVLLLVAGMIGETVLYLQAAQEETVDEAVRLWGIYAGKSRALLEIPIFLVIAYAARMLPELRFAYLSRNFRRTRDKAMLTLRCMALIVVPFAVYFAVAAPSVMGALYHTGELELAAAWLRIGSIAIVFSGLAAALLAVLRSADMTLSVVLDTLICTVLHLAALYVLLYPLGLDVYAVVYANIILAVTLCFACFFSIRRQLKIHLSWIRILLAPCIGGIVMALVCMLLSFVLLKNASDAVNAVLTALIGFAVYFLTVVLLRGATEKELSSFWGGEYIVAVAKLLRIL